MIYAYRQSNFAITGGGTLDGQASNEHWWPWSARPEFGYKTGMPKPWASLDQLRAQGEAGVPVAQRVYGKGHVLRPSFFEPYGCSRVMISGVRIRNAPFWVLHPFLSQQVIVRNVTISSMGPNNDGCDPECCSDVLIEGASFETGDDCIAVKSGRGRDGIVRGVPSQDIVIRNCRATQGNGVVATGSEGSGGIRNIFAENLTVANTDEVLLMKSTTYRGGTHENVYVRKVTARGLNSPAIYMTFYPGQEDDGPYTPIFRNVEVSDVTCDGCQWAYKILGYPDDPIRSVKISNSTFTNVRHPEPNVHNVQDLQVTGVRINGQPV
jgi:polygalacturonase